MLGMPSDATVLLNSWNFLQIFSDYRGDSLEFCFAEFFLVFIRWFFVLWSKNV